MRDGLRPALINHYKRRSAVLARAFAVRAGQPRRAPMKWHGQAARSGAVVQRVQCVERSISMRRGSGLRERISESEGIAPGLPVASE